MIYSHVRAGASPGGWQENVLFRELRELGYMVWRDPLRHTMQVEILKSQLSLDITM